MYGGRKVVVPTAPGDSERRAPMMVSPLTLLVLPWSVPIPSVVYRFRCSTDRKFSLAASSMSSTVTSSCMSMKRLPAR
ncbi:Uncharacterised protein [Bordetella pertussis]|nr:Uncharacterised protein [Bordetella pertussis]CFO65236.1 Uncharacterised protein [Bordetella pertussis]CFU79380.1 Uncharacterised protein [Bordetella pertussis]CPH70989.1 Uncharacterised protein [Bordetella pertussis]CPK59197.1 Uncharacterised protein [Bordetella pertussis]